MISLRGTRIDRDARFTRKARIPVGVTGLFFRKGVLRLADVMCPGGIGPVLSDHPCDIGPERVVMRGAG